MLISPKIAVSWVPLACGKQAGEGPLPALPKKALRGESTLYGQALFLTSSSSSSLMEGGGGNLGLQTGEGGTEGCISSFPEITPSPQAGQPKPLP